ncbi:ice-binding family protein [Candidatus Nitrosotenuis chungbukensis]|uniref:ice-binding family protein n=1 Tax=Candidatus Nitrosotenuis chungbukensis TaxID=1353246 RepID=UPI002673930E|nr:ice-binding family protein [Candidatus Nitrosotenuis chungbukensis]WKT57428.1 ice-binding family protein [Candidatus Nitrosotenuis chungbukensis]
MTRNNIKNYFVMSVLILSASGMIQNNAFAAPTLGTASNFAVLGGTTVTNTGNTVVTGDLGVASPGVACTGFVGCTTTGLGTVTGTIHVGDPIANQAHADAATAYGSLIGATCTTIEPAVADIGGQTLTPGVYCFPSSAAITGTLTLDGSGVYIFKIGSTLVTTAENSNVVLINGATADNIFWAVGSSATLGTNSVLEGTVIAYTSITATAGATVDGRLLAINGAVTMDTNNVTVVGTGDGGNGNHDDDEDCTGGHGHDHDGKDHDGKGGHGKGHDKDHDNKGHKDKGHDGKYSGKQYGKN